MSKLWAMQNRKKDGERVRIEANQHVHLFMSD